MWKQLYKLVTHMDGNKLSFLLDKLMQCFSQMYKRSPQGHQIDVRYCKDRSMRPKSSSTKVFIPILKRKKSRSFSIY